MKSCQHAAESQGEVSKTQNHPVLGPITFLPLCPTQCSLLDEEVGTKRGREHSSSDDTHTTNDKSSRIHQIEKQDNYISNKRDQLFQ